jgi:hypothetical protein
VFHYYVLPLTEDMKHVALHRYNQEHGPAPTSTHFYPFSTLGPLRSHIHPHFVVFSAGQKLDAMASNITEDEFEIVLDDLAKVASLGHEGVPAAVERANRDSLQLIIEIFDQWSSPIGVPRVSDTPRHAWLKHPKAPKDSK